MYERVSETETETEQVTCSYIVYLMSMVNERATTNKCSGVGAKEAHHHNNCNRMLVINYSTPDTHTSELNT